MDFTLAGIQAFVEVAERESIREAAESLGYTPSAISQRLTGLENRLGVELFERLGNSIKVNATGQQLHQQALKLQAAVEAFGINAANVLGQRRAIALGGFPSGLSIAIAPALGQLRELGVDVKLITVEDAQGQQDLRLGSLDLLLLQEYVVRAPRQQDFTYHEVFTEPLALVSSAEIHNLEEAGIERWIISNPKTVCGHGVRDICRRAGFAPDIVADIEDFGLQLDIVASGLGVAILPRSAIAAHHSLDLWVKELAGTSRTILAATRTSSEGDETIAQCLTTIRSHRPPNPSAQQNRPLHDQVGP
ncbi:MAG: LysR family transcriptional regulator [Actinobacteria bacterium]|nr:LysR family transcriptional regulator [Actinomycetota bacterium]